MPNKKYYEELDTYSDARHYLRIKRYFFNLFYIFLKKYKKTLEIEFNPVYYYHRYSGIVQSVEQRTVNFLDSIFPKLDKTVYTL